MVTIYAKKGPHSFWVDSEISHYICWLWNKQEKSSRGLESSIKWKLGELPEHP